MRRSWIRVTPAISWNPPRPAMRSTCRT
jgi:hypothetical protein